MRFFNRNKCFFQVISICCTILFAGSVFAAAMGGARIIPNGKVAVYDGATKIAELTAEAPLPDGKMLKTDGNCGVKMDSLYLVAVDKSEMMVRAPESDRQLMVREGRVYFGITALPRPMTLVTPNGAVRVQQVHLKASTENSLLKGYVMVNEKTAEIGVIEGGAMIISTADGEQKIDSGQRFILAQAKVPAEKEDDDDAAGGILLGSGTVGTVAFVGIPAATLLLGNAIKDDTVSPKN